MFFGYSVLEEILLIVQKMVSVISVIVQVFINAYFYIVQISRKIPRDTVTIFGMILEILCSDALCDLNYVWT